MNLKANEKLQETVEDTILFIFINDDIKEITVECFYDLFLEYCDTDLSMFFIRCYMLNLVCRDILECNKGVFRFKKPTKKIRKKS